jgi:flagellar biosynthetic protein FliO
MMQRRRQVGFERKAPFGWQGLLILSLLTIHNCASVTSAQEIISPATTQPASVEDGKIGETPKESSSSDPYEAWGQLLLAMGIVVGLIVGLGWLVKRLGGSKGLRNAGALKLVARASLSPKHQMFLVRVGSRLVLIGAGPQGLATLSEITDAGEAAELLRSAGMKDTVTEGGKA